ncbi:MAG: glycosyltransferase family 2 protein, partial [Pseudomonadota bacterium]
QRNWGLENGDFRHDWVLHLDADEIVPGAFVEALKTLQVEDGIDAYHVPSKMMLFGRWIRHAGMYPTYQVRLGHKDRLRFVQVGHGQREDLPPSRVGTFSEPYLHYSFAHGMERWLSKHIRYARDEAGLILEYRKLSSEKSSPEGATERRRNAKVKAAKIPVILRPLMRFFYVYLIKQGFRDGRGGLAYALMLSVYEGMTAIFVLQTLLGGSAIPEHGNQKGK